MDKVVDCRGLACPEPVILTKKALDELSAGTLLTIVDNEVALNNVTRLVKQAGLPYNIDQEEGNYHIHIQKEIGEETDLEQHPGSVAVLITSNVMGKGSEELGGLLMKNFLYTLTQMEESIKCVLFMNSGVFLTTEGSEVVMHLQSLEQRGVDVLSCGTCLDFYGLKDKLAVGEVSNMYTLTEQMMQAASVISL